jgi:hypothetical protein
MEQVFFEESGKKRVYYAPGMTRPGADCIRLQGEFSGAGCGRLRANGSTGVKDVGVAWIESDISALTYRHRAGRAAAEEETKTKRPEIPPCGIR